MCEDNLVFFNYCWWSKLKRDDKLDELQFDKEDTLEWEKKHDKEVNEIDIQKVGHICLFENYSYLEYC